MRNCGAEPSDVVELLADACEGLSLHNPYHPPPALRYR